MSEENLHRQETQHAFLVAWGWFAQHIGLIQAIHNVPLHQKTYKHSPHTKILEFLVALLGGLPYLLDVELARLRQQGERIVYDGDLTGLPVSPGSRTYPNAAFGGSQ